jgi:APA family basic amino acid/polyamine antiporter
LSDLKKELGVLDVFAVAAGAMISSGLFVLPAIAFTNAGPAVILSYLFASLLILPTALSQSELSTAMPRSGGMYFYVERSLGSMMGLFSGLADWFSLVLKSTFAVVGVAIVAEFIVAKFFNFAMTDWHLKQIAILTCLFFTVLNIISVKEAGRFQIFLVLVLLAILVLFVVFGVKHVDVTRYGDFVRKGWGRVLATAGLVFVSFAGLNKVVNVAEEVRQPGRNIPAGILSAWLVVSLFYVAVVAVTVGIVDAPQLSQSLLPISLAASKFMPWGFAILGIAAVAAFVTTANAGILAASRSPMAMSRDGLLPAFLSKVDKRFQTPYVSILLTGGFMITAVIFLDIEMLAKTASTLLIILYILANISVIVMRESRIQSYQPKFKSPLYPYVHIVTIILYGILIIDMGKVPLLITATFICLSAIWYVLYVYRRVQRASAVMHVVERVTARELITPTLENELCDILVERDNIVEDRFDRLIRQSEILDLKARHKAEEVFQKIAEILEQRLDVSRYVVLEKFLAREEQGGTIIQPGLAIPHIIIEGEKKFDILLVRAVDGIDFPNATEPVKAMFVLVGSRDERNYHLRALMAIAQIAQHKDFEKKWLTARDTDALRNLVLLSARKREITA